MSETYTPDKLLAGTEFPALTKAGTLLAGQSLPRGAVLGAVGVTVPATGTGGTNTGDGTCTGVAGKALTIPEVWKLTCIGAGAPTAGAAAGAAVAGNTGDGAITATPTVGTGAKTGVYRAVCIEPATNAGKFTIEDPDGITVGIATVGVEFVGGGLTFTIADGTEADFASGDSFTITVAAVAGNGGVFSVVGSKSGRFADASVGVAYANERIGFTINDGDTDFAVGDTFTITVTAGAGGLKLVDKTAVDGSQNPVGILAEAVDATLADKPAVYYETGIFNRNALTLADGTVYTDIQDALRLRGVFLRDMRTL